MDIVVKGRNVEVPEHYRVHVAEKLTRVERYDHKAIRYDVELFHERNPRQAKSCQRVEITGRCRKGVVRAEACGPDFYAALDTALSKLENRLRRVADRRKVHHGRRQPTSVAEATAPLASVLAGNADGAAAASDMGTGVDTGSEPGIGAERRGGTERGIGSAPGSEFGSAPGTGAGRGSLNGSEPEFEYDLPTQRAASASDDADSGEPGRIVRHKHHSSTPMTVDQALYEMELVGHDFYLFADADSGMPSVVYRRRGFHYGVIQLA